MTQGGRGNPERLCSGAETPHSRGERHVHEACSASLLMLHCCLSTLEPAEIQAHNCLEVVEIY